MKVLVRQISPRRLLQWGLRWGQRFLFAGAIVMLGYCGFVVLDTWMFQRRESQDFDRQLQDGPKPGLPTRLRPPTRSARTRHGSPNASAAPHPSGSQSDPAIANSIQNAQGGLIGRIEIERLGLSVMVVEGTRNSILRRAAGHIAGTAFPGEPGNVGISAHRDTFFRPLRNVQRDDIITLTTLDGEYRYRVVSMKVVNPDNVSVLRPDGSEILTLVTCYPFYFVGAAPRRFIVRAERVKG